MVRLSVFAQKISRAAARLESAERLFGAEKEAFLQDEKSRDLATFYLFLAIQECLDIAAHWVADSGWGPSESAGYVFDLLADKKLISPKLAGEMRLSVGLRNLIAHSYAVLDHERLYEEFHQGVEALHQFLAIAAEAAEA